MRGGGSFHNIISISNLYFAWKEFKLGKSKKKDVFEFEKNLEENLIKIHQDLQDKKYNSDPYTDFFVCDPKRRHIHKATVCDRVLHQAVYRQVYKICDSKFIYDSYSCRPGKGTHAGVKRLENFIIKATKNNTTKIWYLKCDVKKFFDSVSHKVLKQKISEFLIDKDTKELCENIINSFSKSPNRGLPLGNVTSQIFANIYMNSFDQFVKHVLKVKYYIRYADDFVILDENKSKLFDLLEKIRCFLDTELKLSLHDSKLIFGKVSHGVDFLGYVIFPHHKIVRVSTQKRAIRRLSENPNEASLNSYIAITKHANALKLRNSLVKIYQNKI